MTTQEIIALALVVASALYLMRYTFHGWRQSTTSGCGGCGCKGKYAKIVQK